MLVAALVTENTGCAGGPDKFHVDAFPVSSKDVPGKLTTNVLPGKPAPTLPVLLNVPEAPVTVPPMPLFALIVPAVSVTDPVPALMTAGVNALASVKLMTVPPAATVPTKSLLAFASVIEPAPA